MREGTTWRVVSDYIGAGKFLLDQERIVVGTPYGVQCQPFEHAGLKKWKVDLGSRCIGLRGMEDGAMCASCTGGLFLLESDGEVRGEVLLSDELIHEAVPLAGGLVLAGKTTLSRREGLGQLVWEFDLKQVLGKSIKSVRLVNLFALDDHVVAGAVDYDSGIGRVVVLDASGKLVSTTDPGPLSELFPAGRDRVVWCWTGYGKFETHATRLNGKEVWSREFAGVGSTHADGSIAMLVGSNESPQWDDWEYRRLAADGRDLDVAQGKGRCPVRPLCREDGSTVFVGSAFYLDPAGSRVDYTNFFRMPQELLFQHLLGIHPQVPEYDVFVQKLPAGGRDLEVVYSVSGSFSLCEPRMLGKYVVFCDGTDIVGVEA
jgi:hypothetical protein